jgi:hypothetical protein
MNTQSAITYLRCHREGLAGEDALIVKAVKMASRDNDLRVELAAQTEFDRVFVSAIAELEIPEGLGERIESERSPGSGLSFANALRQPAFVAVLIAVFVLGGWGIYIAWNRMENFPGRENAARLVEINDEMSGVELEPKTAEIGKLGDWLFSKYGFEAFFVPAELAGAKTAGCRVLKQDGVPVAQLAVEQNNMICYMFRADALGVKLDPDDQWRTFVDGDWVAAVQQHAGNCFLMTFRGKRLDMHRYLESLRQ